jgi:predicted  nucleic acid-binding Zn-ribbon protein
LRGVRRGGHYHYPGVNTPVNYNNSTTEVENLLNQNKILEKNLQNCKNDITNYNMTINKLNEKIKTQNNDINTRLTNERNCDYLTKENNELKTNIKELEEKRNGMLNMFNKNREENADLKREINRLKQDCGNVSS